MKKIFVASLIAFAVAARAADVAPATFNVRDLGAKGDGVTYDTEAVQKALDACKKAGGAVRIPPGKYLCKPLTLYSQTTLMLEDGATLVASPNHSDFLKSGDDWLKAKSSGDFHPFISGKNLTDLTITGGGTIDGNGAVWWEEAEKARQRVPGFTLPRPNLIILTRCKNVRMLGIKLINAPKFHFVPSECEDVIVDGVTILAPERAANTDGIDPSNCRNVKITRCFIDTGDDNIAIKSGRKLASREFGCENIEVTDCTFKHGHGMSIGSEEVGGVRNVVVRNCTFENTENGLRIKSRRGRGGVVENITYTDITLSNVSPAISIAAYYQNRTHDKFPKDDKAQPMTDTTPIFRNITIRNVTGNSTGDAGLIVGLPESPVQNLTLENVNISAKHGLVIASAKDVVFKNVKITPEEGEPLIEHNADVKIVGESK